MYDSIQALAQIRGIKANLSSQLSGVQAQLDALNLAESICLQGVQSDQTRIDADTATGIAKGIEAAVSEATAPLNEQIQTLTDAAAGEADRTAAAVKEATDPLQAIIDGETDRTAKAIQDAIAALPAPVATPVEAAPVPDAPADAPQS